jgi:hypothetical protein
MPPGRFRVATPVNVAAHNFSLTFAVQHENKNLRALARLPDAHLNPIRRPPPAADLRSET